MPLTVEHLAELDDFRDATVANPTRQNAASYYGKLTEFGVSYGALASGVVLDNTFFGVLANNYTVNKIGHDKGAAISDVGDGDANVQNFRRLLVSLDYGLRQAGSDVTGQDISNYHDQAFQQSFGVAGVIQPEEAWTAYHVVRALNDYNVWQVSTDTWQGTKDSVAIALKMINAARTSVDPAVREHSGKWLQDMLPNVLPDILGHTGGTLLDGDNVFLDSLDEFATKASLPLLQQAVQTVTGWLDVLWGASSMVVPLGGRHLGLAEPTFGFVLDRTVEVTSNNVSIGGLFRDGGDNDLGLNLTFGGVVDTSPGSMLAIIKNELRLSLEDIDDPTAATSAPFIFVADALDQFSPETLIFQKQDGAGAVNGGTERDLIIGSTGVSDLAGGDGDDALFAFGGADRLVGGSGNDLVVGGAGADWIVWDTGGDIVDSGTGNDLIEVRGSQADGNLVIVIRAGAGNDELWSPNAYATAGYNMAAFSPLGNGADIEIRFEGINSTDVSLLWDYREADSSQIDESFYSGPSDSYGLIREGDAALQINATGETFYFGFLAWYEVYTGTPFGVEWSSFDLTLTFADSVVIDDPGEFAALFNLGTVAAAALPASAQQAYEDHIAGGGPGAPSGGEPAPAGALVAGTTGADNLTGSDRGERLTGWDGDDTLSAGAGNDVLVGGDGLDQLLGGEGDDSLTGGAGDDTLNGGEGFDVADFSSNISPVSVSLSIGTAQNTGDTGFDVLIAIEDLIGGLGADSLTGSSAANVLVGGGGNDTLIGLLGADEVHGGYGDDVLRGDEGDDLLDGGDGIDVASFFTATLGVTVDLALTGTQNTGSYGFDTFISIENLRGGSGADSFYGDDGANFLEGNAGADTLSGRGGHDSLVGGDGNDLLDGGDGNDTLIGQNGGDELHGGVGNDVLRGDEGDDLLDGGDGVDVASFFTATSGVTVDLALTGAQNTGSHGVDTFVSIENLRGGSGADVLLGNSEANVLEGNAGADTLSGRAGNDSLTGGDGADSLSGDAGNDTLIGDAGSDELYGGAGNDVLRGDAGDDLLNGGDGIDVASYFTATSGVQVDLTLMGGQSTGSYGLDTLIAIENLRGGAGADTLYGDGGANVLEGNGAADILSGRGGNDTLVGGDGGDVLDGGADADQLTGGAGADVIVLRIDDLVDDVITDFSGLGGQGDLLQFVGFSQSANLSHVNDIWTVTDGAVNQSFQISGITSLAAGDYVFA